MTGRKATKGQKRRGTGQQQGQQQAQAQADDSKASSPPQGVRREQPPPPQVVKKILKAENDEARTLKTVFKSNPDSQMKDFIKKAAVRPHQQPVAKPAPVRPAQSEAIQQELLETDDDVADNLAKLFKVSKSYKNL